MMVVKVIVAEMRVCFVAVRSTTAMTSCVALTATTTTFLTAIASVFACVSPIFPTSERCCSGL